MAAAVAAPSKNKYKMYIHCHWTRSHKIYFRKNNINSVVLSILLRICMFSCFIFMPFIKNDAECIFFVDAIKTKMNV